MEHVSRALEWLAVGALIAALALTAAGVARDLLNRAAARATYRRAREILGRGILIGLEILVAADLIRTVAVEPTVRNVAVLGLIVVVRVLLSFAIDVEVDGVLPWRRHQAQLSEAAEGKPN